LILVIAFFSPFKFTIMKKILILISRATVLILLLSLSSCYYDEEVVIPEVEIDPDVVISFKTDIEPLFSQNDKDCTACHDGGINPDLTEGNAFNALVPDYVKAGDADGSKLFLNAPGNDHPQNVGFILSANELALIEAWINNGAENN
jgi:hypothetical protein